MITACFDNEGICSPYSPSRCHLISRGPVSLPPATHAIDAAAAIWLPICEVSPRSGHRGPIEEERPCRHHPWDPHRSL